MTKRLAARIMRPMAERGTGNQTTASEHITRFNRHNAVCSNQGHASETLSMYATNAEHDPWYDKQEADRTHGIKRRGQGRNKGKAALALMGLS
ncbi:MAG: hypothetical protein ACYTEQ_01620 [Planctomycetota bacterium]|jgi:hypothetical protein